MRGLRPASAVRACSTIIVMVVVASGCSILDREAAATWDLAPDQALDADSTTFTALVTRLGCNGGVTGEVNAPDIDLTDEAVVITFTVSPGEPRAADCQGNDAVPVEVGLPEDLGDRALVDGGCDSSDASSTEPCQPDGVRHTS